MAASDKELFVWTKAVEAAGLQRMSSYLGGTPVALLAGFTLTSAFVVLPPRAHAHAGDAGWALVSSCLFLAAAAAFLIALVYAGQGEFHRATPDEVMSWFPAHTLRHEWFEQLREFVWSAQKQLKRLVNRADGMWQLGVALTGLAAGAAVLSYGRTPSHLVAASVGSLGIGAAVLVACRENQREPQAGNPSAISHDAEALFVHRASAHDGQHLDQRDRLRRAAAANGCGGLYGVAEALLEHAFVGKVVASDASLFGTADFNGQPVAVVAVHPFVVRPPRDKEELYVSYELPALAGWLGATLDEVRESFATTQDRVFEFVTSVSQVAARLQKPE